MAASKGLIESGLHSLNHIFVRKGYVAFRYIQFSKRTNIPSQNLSSAERQTSKTGRASSGLGGLAGVAFSETSPKNDLSLAIILAFMRYFLEGTSCGTKFTTVSTRLPVQLSANPGRRAQRLHSCTLHQDGSAHPDARWQATIHLDLRTNDLDPRAAIRYSYRARPTASAPMVSTNTNQLSARASNSKRVAISLHFKMYAVAT